jgi:hypothetical protein
MSNEGFEGFPFLSSQTWSSCKLMTRSVPIVNTRTDLLRKRSSESNMRCDVGFEFSKRSSVLVHHTTPSKIDGSLRLKGERVITTYLRKPFTHFPAPRSIESQISNFVKADWEDIGFSHEPVFLEAKARAVKLGHIRRSRVQRVIQQ